MYNQPLVAIDTIVFRFTGNELQAATTVREHAPHKGQHAIPGLILDGLEKIQEAHYRAIETKLDISRSITSPLRTVGAFDTSDRDPRGPTISICSYVTVSRDIETGKAHWKNIQELDELPFDHNTLILTGVQAVKQALFSDIETTRKLLGDTFTTSEAKALLDASGAETDASNFTRYLKTFSFLEEGEPLKNGPGRPTKTWRFK